MHFQPSQHIRPPRRAASCFGKSQPRSARLSVDSRVPWPAARAMAPRLSRRSCRAMEFSWLSHCCCRSPGRQRTWTSRQARGATPRWTMCGQMLIFPFGVAFPLFAPKRVHLRCHKRRPDCSSNPRSGIDPRGNGWPTKSASPCRAGCDRLPPPSLKMEFAFGQNPCGLVLSLSHAQQVVVRRLESLFGREQKTHS